MKNKQLSILTLLVIATIIITGVYVGYHAHEDSLHEEIKTHSLPTQEKIDQPYLSENLSDGNPKSLPEFL